MASPCWMPPASRSNPICAWPSCASATAPTTTLWPTSRSRPTSTCTAIRCSPPRMRPGTPATRRTRCSPPPPASWARAGWRAFAPPPRRCSTCSWARSRTPATRRRRSTASSPRRPWLALRRTRRAAALLAALDARGAKSVFVRYLRGLNEPVTADAVLAAIALTLAWGPLQRKRISRRTALNLPWHLALYGSLIGASVPGRPPRPAGSAAFPTTRSCAAGAPPSWPAWR